MLFLYNFSYTTIKALDRRAILHASTTSLGSILFNMYAKYGCIHVTSTIITSSGSGVSSTASFLAPGPTIVCCFYLLELEDLVSLIDRSTISSQKTPGGTGRH
jgi:hypothetical protein